MAKKKRDILYTPGHYIIHCEAKCVPGRGEGKTQSSSNSIIEL